MTPTELRDAATLLYGKTWQSCLAEATRVNPRTVRRWAKDGGPPWIESKLRILLGQRIDDIAQFLA